MKGVSAVIVALAALAYTWFTGIFSSLTATTETAVTETTGAMATQFRIEAAKYIGSNHMNATIRNTGTQAFNVSKSTVYVAGSSASLDTTNPFNPGGNLAPGDTSTLYNITNTTEACGKALTVIIATGLSDTKTIVC